MSSMIIDLFDDARQSFGDEYVDEMHDDTFKDVLAMYPGARTRLSASELAQVLTTTSVYGPTLGALCALDHLFYGVVNVSAFPPDSSELTMLMTYAAFVLYDSGCYYTSFIASNVESSACVAVETVLTQGGHVSYADLRSIVIRFVVGAHLNGYDISASMSVLLERYGYGGMYRDIEEDIEEAVQKGMKDATKALHK